MINPNPLIALNRAYDQFVLCIRSLSETQFLTAMNDWSPRDVVAHLIGWNRLMIEASLSILAGQPPAYYADAPNDYSNINAAFVAKHSSYLREDLLHELESSMVEFKAYIAGLSPADLSSDHGVIHYSGRPATISAIITSLAGDYQHHARQISDWLVVK